MYCGHEYFIFDDDGKLRRIQISSGRNFETFQRDEWEMSGKPIMESSKSDEIVDEDSSALFDPLPHSENDSE